jgi:hypothetical protein
VYGWVLVLEVLYSEFEVLDICQRQAQKTRGGRQFDVRVSTVCMIAVVEYRLVQGPTKAISDESGRVRVRVSSYKCLLVKTALLPFELDVCQPWFHVSWVA